MKKNHSFNKKAGENNEIIVLSFEELRRLSPQDWILDFKSNERVRYVCDYLNNRYSLEKHMLPDRYTGQKKPFFKLSVQKGNGKYTSEMARSLWSAIDGRAQTKISYLDAITQTTLNRFHSIYYLDGADIIVRNNTFACAKRHATEDVAILITVCNRKGVIRDIPVLACYCANCDAYYLSEDLYKSLKSQGVILQRIISKNSFIIGNYLNVSFNSAEIASESFLHQLGYNVNMQDNLSDQQRWAILENAVDNGLLTISKIRDHLNYCIAMREGNPSMYNAISKWEVDLDHMAKYKIRNLRRIHANSIIDHKIIFR